MALELGYIGLINGPPLTPPSVGAADGGVQNRVTSARSCRSGRGQQVLEVQR